MSWVGGGQIVEMDRIFDRVRNIGTRVTYVFAVVWVPSCESSEVLWPTPLKCPRLKATPALGRRCFIWPSQYHVVCLCFICLSCNIHHLFFLSLSYHIRSWFILVAFWQWRGCACLCNDILLWGSTAAWAKLHSNSRSKAAGTAWID